VSKETKFGYGFLLAGVGVPNLIDKLFGASTLALVIAALCTIAGFGLLAAGHFHRDKDAAEPKPGVIPVAGTLILIAAVAVTLTVAIWRVVREHAGFRVSPQLIQNGEVVYGLGIWNMDENVADALYPVGIEMFLQLQNVTASATMIDTLEFEIKREADDSWELLPQLTNSAFYGGASPNKLFRLNASMLKSTFYNHNLEPGDTTMGWVFLDYPNSATIPMPDFSQAHSYHPNWIPEVGQKFVTANGYVIWKRVFPFVPEFRAKIATVDGNHYIIPFTLPPIESRWSEQEISFTIASGFQDFSYLPVKFFRLDERYLVKRP
jgi:hypothetical protein